MKKLLMVVALVASAVAASAQGSQPRRTLEELKRVREQKAVAAAGKGDTVSGVNVVAQKLQVCDFLLNKDFKKNAKFYLCLFSASWCPPCRREMPRMAKTYAESLKDDPNIELIHFSRDQNDEKAMAWAKEHDVKFPVVKPKGGNPLELHTRGIPHLFIVDANGKLIEEGHPMKLFTDEKLKALKAGEPTEPETVTEKTRKAIEKLFPGWSLDSEVPQDWRLPGRSGFYASHRGRNNIIRLHPMNRDTPVVLSRMVKLPDNNPCLALCVSSWNDDADFLLSVRVNGKDALTNRLVCTPDAVPWEDIVVPLSPWRGRSVKLEIILLRANNLWCEWSHLARVDIIEADGDMSIREGKCEVGGYTWSYRAQNGEATIVAENDGRFSTAVSPCPIGCIAIPATLAGAKVTRIGRDAFLDCSALTSVIIPEGVSRIGRGAFHDCTGLKSIKIPSSVKIIERDAFAGCNGLASVSIPEGVTSIDRAAFYWCCGLESIEIPSSVTHIGRDAFRFCLGLSSITIPERVTDIGDSAFHGCNALTSVTISASVTNINHVAFRNTGALTTFQVDPGNQYYKSENGLLLTKDGTTLVRGVNGDATIPSSVTAIGTCAFEGCVALRSAEIPSGVKSIGSFAFTQCRGMKSVTIPSSVSDIGQQAFSCCGSLTSVTMRGERPNAPDNIFKSCGNLKSIHVPANAKSWAGMKDWFGIPLVFDAAESNVASSSMEDRSSVASILKGMIKLPGRDCWLSATEVTQGQWESVMGYNNSERKGVNLPVEMVSRDDCDVFLEKLNQTEEVKSSQFEFSLPSYEEWVCAAAAGCVDRWNCWIKPGVGGDVHDTMWYKENSSNQIHAVATKAANAFGFYDMLGNVWEWTAELDGRGRGIRRGLSCYDEIHGMNYRWYTPRHRRWCGCGLRLAAHIRSGNLSDGCGKAGSSESDVAQRQETLNGYTWSYRVKNGEAMIVTANGACAVSPRPTGDIAIPSTLGGVKVTSIGNNAFRNCRGLTSVTIPSGVASIGSAAFGDCAELRNVTIPESVRDIGEWAFSGCFALKSLAIPPNVERIGGGAFIRCRGLTSVTIPAKVVSIGGVAFGYCSALRQINVDAGNQSFTSIDGVLYTKDQSVLLAFPNALTSVKIPQGVTNIGGWAFEGCNSLKSVTIPEGVTTIENNAFKECGGLESVVMPSGLKKIGWDAFDNCRSLKSVTIPDGVCYIGGRAFRGCGELASLTLPKGLTTIGDHAFWGCGKLTSLTLPKGLTKIGRGAFRGLGKLTTVTIPAEVTSIGGGVFSYCGGLTQINVEAGNQKYTSVDGVLYTKDLTELVMCPNGLNSVTIPESVTSIGLGAFVGCSKLTSVILPSGVSRIGEWAFEACNGLTSATIPEKVTKIDKCAFYGCGELTSFTMRGERPDAPNDIFNGCGNLKTIHVPANSKSWAGLKEWQGKTLVFDGLKMSDEQLAKESEQAAKEAERQAQAEADKQQREAEREEHRKQLLAIQEELKKVREAKAAAAAFEGDAAPAAASASNGLLRRPGLLGGGLMGGTLRERRLQRQQEAQALAAARQQEAQRLAEAKAAAAPGEGDTVSGVNVVAQKLQVCDFLLNKDFKKNAKFYLCLFSASWCPPCRREMPRIAKAYAETLKDDPDIELIHFSRDQNDEKALAWAKEHDVKFPVVKPKGGNPLDLHSRGIPHLFIVDANGKLIEEGHPAKLFTDEKLRELKAADGGERAAGKTKMQLSGKEMIDGVEWTYSIKDGKAQVDYASSSNATGAISIPSTLGGCPVTSIRGRQYGQPGVFGKCSKLTSVTIPSSVTSIGDRAFERCTNLTSVTIQSSATSIGGFAFFGCNSLVSIVIPSGVTSIGWRAFACCRGLTSVTISSSVKRIERGAFLSCDNLMSISVEPDNPSYSSRNGLLCSKDGSILVAGVNGDVTIPSSVTHIGDGAFDGYGGLTSVTIPDSVTRIGKRAFAICSRLTSVKIPSSVTSIGGDAFNGTPFYRNLPDGMVVLGGGVLCGYKGKCPSAVVIPSNVTSIAGEAFSERFRYQFLQRRDAGLKPDRLKTVVIASSVTNIGDRAFSYCGELTSVTMRGERPNAPNNIFERCGNLKSIRVPANAKSWAGMKDWFGIPLVFGGESKAEDSWNSAQDVEYKFNYKLDDKGNAILTGVSPKPEGALVCPNIIEGHKVTGIDRGAFNGCDKMTKIMLPEHLETLPVWVSGWCIHGSIFCGCTALSSIGISEKNPKFASVDGALYSKDKKVLFAYPKDRTEIKVCRETTSIHGDAFHSSLLFKKINVPEGIRDTGGFTFSGCPNLEEVVFPKGLEYIRHRAFLGCPNMKKVVFCGDAPVAPHRRTASRENVFYGAARDIVVYVRKGSKGWNGKDSTDLPGRWPLDGSDSRPIRYIDEADAKSRAGMKDWFGIPLVFDAETKK